MSYVQAVETALVSCNHCGIVVVNPREFGWKMWHEPELTEHFEGTDHGGIVQVARHHCPAAIQWNDMLAGGLIHGTDPNDAVIYEDWPEDATVP